MRRAGGAALAALLATAAPVAAQPAPDAAHQAAARAHFDRARELHAKKQYLEAADEYLAAFAEAPLPAFLYNAAQVFRLAGEREHAILHYRRYLELEPTGEGADDARAFLAELEGDGERAIEPAPAPEPDAEDEPIDPIPPAPGPPTPADPPQRDDGRSGRPLRVAGLVSLGVGAIALGAAAGFAFKARSASNDLGNHEGEWTPAEADLYRAGEDAERYMLISLGVGAAALAAGGVLVLLGQRADARAADAHATIAPTSAGAIVLLGARF
jgi:tetratricopeptide (TPR) repeat protein